MLQYQYTELFSLLQRLHSKCVENDMEVIVAHFETLSGYFPAETEEIMKDHYTRTFSTYSSNNIKISVCATSGTEILCVGVATALSALPLICLCVSYLKCLFISFVCNIRNICTKNNMDHCVNIL